MGIQRQVALEGSRHHSAAAIGRAGRNTSLYELRHNLLLFLFDISTQFRTNVFEFDVRGHLLISNI
jgi:hypothetical protein